MARITDLSNELLLHIGSFLHLRLSAKQFFRAQREEKGRELILHEHRASFLNLCVVSKRFNGVFTRELYRFASIQSRNGPRQLLSLLRLLRFKPGLFHCIERVYLDLRPAPYGGSSLSHTQMLPMKTWAEELGLTVDNNIMTTLALWQSHDGRILSSQFSPEERRNFWQVEQNSLAVLAAILLASLHRAQEVAFSTTAGVLRHIPVCLGIAGSQSNAPQGNLLPALKSLVLRSAGTQITDIETHRLSQTEIHHLTAMWKSISEVCLNEICISQDENIDEAEKPESRVASLIFQNVHFRHGDSSIETLLVGYRNISKFGCYNTGTIFHPFGFFLPTPRRLTDALANEIRANKLKSLCIYMDPFPKIDTCRVKDVIKEESKACKPLEALGSLEAFSNLELLYIDKWSFRNGPKTNVLVKQRSKAGDLVQAEVEVHDVILTLPHSLRWLAVGGCTDGVTGSVSWFANNRRSMPHFYALAIRRCKAEGYEALTKELRGWIKFSACHFVPFELL
ncbi:uncharacterized protein ColSpa_06377 [Colletotrichum spaethianum]|uniref:Uncharacterized protein n=1 Tax=Colletotrichum spaethianum TaxID=700344 RepID=A0AA37LCM9_9PEZI|nr:uncharacterized protein ColSpa_06377 [Colletotrichum spaethianum]GKT46196.1 hypothetical protein ColSpa_06377 [Colletotrichum spaethianum]